RRAADRPAARRVQGGAPEPRHHRTEGGGMSTVCGGVFTSHVPGIGAAIAKGLQQDPYWKPFFDGFAPVHDFLEREKPDVAVVFYNDHGRSEERRVGNESR